MTLLHKTNQKLEWSFNFQIINFLFSFIYDVTVE